MQLSDCCPLCGKTLQLKQINLDTAIIMCVDMSCSYPVNGECVLVKRNITDIKKLVDIKLLMKDAGNLSRNVEECNDLIDLNDFMSELNSQLNNENMSQSKEVDDFLMDLLQ